MKKRLPTFLAGMLTTALVCGLTVSALAANGLISINASLNNIAIQVNGEPAIAKGENYTPDSGKETAGSILYNETTYVPLRKVGELLGADIEWDASTGTANIVGQIEAPVVPSTPPDNTAPTDYSDWTPEEEAAYQEFKGMWEVEDRIPSEISGGWHKYCAIYSGNSTKADVVSIWVSEYAERMAIETVSNNDILFFFYIDADAGEIALGQASVFSDGSTSSGLYN